MENKIFTVAIIGVGNRGGDSYGSLINQFKDRFKITALCDFKKERTERFGELFGVDKENRFNEEEKFFEKKRADVLVIATLDTDHVRQALRAMELGYDILVEKPLTGSKEDCDKLLAAQKKYGVKVFVCHVLRYSPAFIKVAELLDSGIIGKLIAIDALERVGYYHQPHSYVRGNWRNTKVAMPMILAKCCHDLDLLQYYAKSTCETVSSIGDLAFFKEDNAPEGAAKRCVNCKHVDTCVYSAKNLYLKSWNDKGKPKDEWPYNVIAAAPITEEKIIKAIEEGPYGRCVFKCDNDVVDHQITLMNFKNGVKASLTMTAFTARGGRRMDFHGTLGEIVLDEEERTICVKPYGKPEEKIDISLLTAKEKGMAHGGGDYGIISSLYDILTGKGEEKTSLARSVESHLMGIAAEESRINDGKLVKVHE